MRTGQQKSVRRLHHLQGSDRRLNRHPGVDDGRSLAESVARRTTSKDTLTLGGQCFIQPMYLFFSHRGYLLKKIEHFQWRRWDPPPSA